MNQLHLAALGAALAAASATLSAQGPQVRYFDQIASYGVTGGIAEIVTASPDGRTLAFSDASGGRIGFVDITNAAAPAALPDVVTGGSPTSVSWVGNYVIAAVITTPPVIGQPAPNPNLPANAGALVVIDASNPAAPSVLGSIAVGYQPDSVKAFHRNGALVAVVCIENQPIVVDGSGVVEDEDAPGFPNDISPAGLVQVVSIDTGNLANSTVADVVLPAATLSAAGCLYPNDPQPEFVDVRGRLAAVTLQENNGIAIIDIDDPTAPSLVRVFACGHAAERLTDLTEDDAIVVNQGYPSSIGTTVTVPTDGGGNPVPGAPRMPDAVAFTPDGSRLLTADEGELPRTGGRGFSMFRLDGTLAFTDAGEVESLGVTFGQYPDGRSLDRGVEVEGIAAARYGNLDFAFVGSERGSYLCVYELQQGRNPRFVQLLPTGISPEGLLPIPQRNLFVTADEASGTLTIYRGTPQLPDNRDEPLLYSTRIPFGAQSGFEGLPFGVLSVPDDALPTSINFFGMGGDFAEVRSVVPVRRNGVQARYDGEGITLNTSVLSPFRLPTGFFLASEGTGTTLPNLIVQVDLAGRVVREIQMPNHIDAAADASIGGNARGPIGGGRIRSNGFEGLTLSPNGRYIYACVQRSFAGEGATHTRIARYDLMQIRNNTAPSNGLRFGGDWEFFYYPLQAATGAGFIGLSEITAIGNDRFLVIERDQGVGSETALKAVYAFTIAGCVPDTDGVPGEAGGNDVATKALVKDVRAGFFPFEKVEGIAIVNGRLIVGLDNDGGEVANRVIDFGRFVSPF